MRWARGRASTTRSSCRSCSKVAKDLALCLVCGATFCAGRCGSNASRSDFEVGNCTAHAIDAHKGNGIYLLLLENMVVLLRGSTATYHRSVYVDSNGEDVRHIMGGKHRPLFLDWT